MIGHQKCHHELARQYVNQSRRIKNNPLLASYAVPNIRVVSKWYSHLIDPLYTVFPKRSADKLCMIFSKILTVDLFCLNDFLRRIKNLFEHLLGSKPKKTEFLSHLIIDFPQKSSITARG